MTSHARAATRGAMPGSGLHSGPPPQTSMRCWSSGCPIHAGYTRAHAGMQPGCHRTLENEKIRHDCWGLLVQQRCSRHTTLKLTPSPSAKRYYTVARSTAHLPLHKYTRWAAGTAGCCMRLAAAAAATGKRPQPYVTCMQGGARACVAAPRTCTPEARSCRHCSYPPKKLLACSFSCSLRSLSCRQRLRGRLCRRRAAAARRPGTNGGCH